MIVRSFDSLMEAYERLLVRPNPADEHFYNGLFQRYRNPVLTREHILNAAWSYDYLGDTRVVDTIIKTLRQKLIKDDVNFTIRTIYGIGYKIEAKQ